MSDVPTPAPGLFILGMHRSGTSCLAGMLECAGFNPGLVDEWNPDNRKGNREHLAVTPLNEAVLRVNGGAWDRPPGRVAVDDRQRRQMERIVADLEAQGSPWFIKDPRILLFPDPWLDLRPGLRSIGIFRHPLAVAQSLERRDGLSLADGVGLWCGYNDALLERLDAGAFPLLLFTPDPGEFTRLVQAALTVSFEDEIQADTVAPDAVGQFFSADLVHHAPALYRDIGPELEAAGLPAGTARAATRTWQRLLERQSPVKLILDERGDAPPETPATVDVQGSDSDLDRIIGASDDPTHLFRRRIAEMEEAAAHKDLHRWLEGWLERRPEDPFLSWELARLEWALGRRDEALARAETTSRLAPGWIVPLERMAEWAMETGDWQTATGAFERLRKAERALVKMPELTMQLYFDQGDGFNEAASIKLPLTQRTGHFETTIEAGPLGRGVRQLRLDPINQPAVVAGVSLHVVNESGEAFDLAPTDDNAVFHDGRAWHFDDDDPKLVYLDERVPRHPLRSLRVAFDIEHVGEDARLAGFQAMKAMAGRLEALEDALEAMTSRHDAAAADLLALTKRHEMLVTDIRDLDGMVTVLRESRAARLGTQVARAIMAPTTFGRGHTSLDDLAERWRALTADARDESAHDEPDEPSG